MASAICSLTKIKQVLSCGVAGSNPMVRWLSVLALEGGSATTSWLASAGGFLLAVTCVLAVAAVVTASCAMHFHRRDGKNRGSTGFNSPHKFPGRAIIGDSKKNLISKKWRRKGNDEETYDRDPRKADHGGTSRKWGRNEDEDESAVYDREFMNAEDGEDSVWQRRILMGERCQPPEFSGLINYDDKGNRVPQFPLRSPMLNILGPSPDQVI